MVVHSMTLLETASQFVNPSLLLFGSQLWPCMRHPLFWSLLFFLLCDFGLHLGSWSSPNPSPPESNYVLVLQAYNLVLPIFTLSEIETLVVADHEQIS